MTRAGTSRHSPASISASESLSKVRGAIPAFAGIILSGRKSDAARKVGSGLIAGGLYDILAGLTQEAIDAQVAWLEGRLDAISGNSVSLHYLVKNMGLDPQVGKQLVLQVAPVTVHVSKHYTDVNTLRRIESAVQRLKRQGVFEAIIDRWIGRRWRIN